MTMMRPSIGLDFANGSNFVDPRITSARASTASYYDRLGVLKYRPANAMRLTASPTSGLAGVRCEATKTNLLLWSEAFDNAAWTKTSASVSADSSAAPDGNTTADTITTSGSGGNANQAVTISAGQYLSLSVYAKPGASNWLWLKIGDGTNAVSAWFNVNTGAMGTSTAGAGTVTLSYADIGEKAANGLYRCNLHVATNTSTSLTCSVAGAANDNTVPNTADSIIAWGACAVTATSFPRFSTYIPTTSATATRASETNTIAFDSSLMSSTAGTLFVELMSPQTTSGTIMAGIGDNAGNDTARLTCVVNPGASVCQIFGFMNSGGVTQANVGTAANIPSGPDVPIKCAFAFALNDCALVVNGAVALTDTSCALPTVWTRMGVGNGSSGSAGGNFILRRQLYWPGRLPNSQMQLLTAA